MVLGRHEERKGVARRDQRGSIAQRGVEAIYGDSRSWARVRTTGPWRPSRQGTRLIDFVGASSDEEKRAWLRRANALVAPSLRGESLGIVLLEGMASETSVVASDIEGYHEAASGFATSFAPGTTRVSSARSSARWPTRPSVDRERRRPTRASGRCRRLMDRYEEIYSRRRRAISRPGSLDTVATKQRSRSRRSRTIARPRSALRRARAGSRPGRARIHPRRREAREPPDRARTSRCARRLPPSIGVGDRVRRTGRWRGRRRLAPAIGVAIAVAVRCGTSGARSCDTKPGSGALGTSCSTSSRPAAPRRIDFASRPSWTV